MHFKNASCLAGSPKRFLFENIVRVGLGRMKQSPRACHYEPASTRTRCAARMRLPISSWNPSVLLRPPRRSKFVLSKLCNRVSLYRDINRLFGNWENARSCPALRERTETNPTGKLTLRRAGSEAVGRFRPLKTWGNKYHMAKNVRVIKNEEPGNSRSSCGSNHQNFRSV